MFYNKIMPKFSVKLKTYLITLFTLSYQKRNKVNENYKVIVVYKIMHGRMKVHDEDDNNYNKRRAYK